MQNFHPIGWSIHLYQPNLGFANWHPWSPVYTWLTHSAGVLVLNRHISHLSILRISKEWDGKLYSLEHIGCAVKKTKTCQKISTKSTCSSPCSGSMSAHQLDWEKTQPLFCLKLSPLDLIPTFHFLLLPSSLELAESIPQVRQHSCLNILVADKFRIFLLHLLDPSHSSFVLNKVQTNSRQSWRCSPVM